MKTLRDRLAAAMKGPPPVSQVDLARAAGVKQPSVNDWLSGKTKSIRGPALMAVARRLAVSPDWLASGKGPMRDQSANLERAPQSQAVKLDPATMLSALKYLERRARECNRSFDPFADTDLLCWAYEIEEAGVAAPSNVIDFGQEVLKRFSRGNSGDAKGRTG